jgi:hypothetical protein
MYVGTDRTSGDTVGYFVKLVVVAIGIGCAFGIALTILLALVYRCDHLAVNVCRNIAGLILLAHDVVTHAFRSILGIVYGQ